MIVAIDGPAASGKSTVAKALAVRLGIHYLDTGAMYRSIALKALESGTPLDGAETLSEMAATSRIEFEHEGEQAIPTRVLLDGRDVTAAIRTPAVDEAVSVVASIPGVRTAMVAGQRRIGRAEDCVVEGRDIGTSVFPDAEVKVYLTASEAERARRRMADRAAAGHGAEAETVLANIGRRDALDSSREASPLVAASDAVMLDTTGLSVPEVVERIASWVEDAKSGRPSS